MSNDLERFHLWRRGMAVRRWHSEPLEPQTVGHHSCGVALIIGFCHPEPSALLLLAALQHDLPEALLGDVSAWAKHSFPDVGIAVQGAEYTIMRSMNLCSADSLNDKDQACLWLADTLEAYVYCIEQEQQGNRGATEIARRLEQWLQDSGHWDLTPRPFFLLFKELFNLRNMPHAAIS